MGINKNLIKKLDSSDVLGSIDLVPKQAMQAWQETKKVKIPQSYKKVESVVVCGMGGSAIGPHLVKTLFSDKIKLPIQIINGYALPAYAGPKTLVLLSSYSGTTEEVLSCARQAKAKKAKAVFMCTGGTLAKMGKANRWPGYVFTAKFNPCGQPRVAVGNSIFGCLGILKKAGLVNVSDKEAGGMIHALAKYVKKFGMDSAISSNAAKRLSMQLKNKLMVLIGSEFLEGNMHIAVNQINETSKQFAAYFLLPEINHHLLEGLSFPARPKRDMVFVFFESNKYHEKTQKRYKLTRRIIEKNSIKTITYKLGAKDKLGQAAEMLMLGSYVSFYLGMLNGQDPAFIPWVKYLKKKLK